MTLVALNYSPEHRSALIHKSSIKNQLRPSNYVQKFRPWQLYEFVELFFGRENVLEIFFSKNFKKFSSFQGFRDPKMQPTGVIKSTLLTDILFLVEDAPRADFNLWPLFLSSRSTPLPKPVLRYSRLLPQIAKRLVQFICRIQV